MNKTDLAREITRRFNMEHGHEEAGPFPLTAGREFLDLMLEVVTDELKHNGKVVLSGFGTLFVREQKARAGINPRTGESLRIPARRVPAFKPGKTLKLDVR